MAKGKSVSGSHTPSPNLPVANSPRLTLNVTPPTLGRIYDAVETPTQVVRVFAEQAFRSITAPVQPNVNKRRVLPNLPNQFIHDDAPLRALICAKRRIRKEIMFALKRTKKGAGASKRRRNHESRVKC